MDTAKVEASIIGSLILYPELFQEAAKVLIPTRQSGVRVFREYNRIWDWMVKTQLEQMRSWDIQLVSSKFKDVPELIRQAEPETLSSSILYLREEYERAVLKKVCEDALQRLGEESPYSVASDVLSNLTDEEPEVKEKLRGDEIFEAWQDIEKGEIGVKTVWDEYNSYTGGAKEGQTLVVGGTTGTGKTERALELLLGFAKSGMPCAFFSMELTKKAVWQRIIHIESGLSMEQLSTRVFNQNTGEYQLMLTKEDALRLANAVKLLGTIPIFVHDVTDSTNKASMIMQKIRWYKRNGGLFAYCIDFIQQCATGIERIDNSGHDMKVLTRFASELSQFNKKANVFGVWVSQLSREMLKRSDRRPRSSDLYGTSALENAADSILLFHRPRAYEDIKSDEDGRIYNLYDTEFVLTKNRTFGGKLGSWWQYEEIKPKVLLKPVFERIEMPKVDPDEDLPF